MDGMLIFTIIGVAITALGIAAGGLWTYNESVKKQFEDINIKAEKQLQETNLKAEKMMEIIFRRLDENKKSYWENFVSREVHDLQLENMKERYDEHYLTLNKKIDELVSLFKDSAKKREA